MQNQAMKNGVLPHVRFTRSIVILVGVIPGPYLDLFRYVSGTGQGRYWTHHGRSNELQSFHSGGKWYPVMKERRLLAEYPGLVQEFLIIGTGLDKAVILLEPSPKFRRELEACKGDEGATTAKHKFGDSMDQILLTLQKINKNLPVYARVGQIQIIVTDLAQRMLRTGKRNVQRRQTVKAYEREIRAVVSINKIEKES